MKRLIAYLLVCCPMLLPAQNTSNLGIDYFADLGVNPGFKLFLDKPLKTEITYDTDEKLKVSLISQQVIRANLIGYYNIENYSAIAIIPELLLRFNNAKSSFVELGFGIGYHRSFLDAVSYVVSPDGSIQIQALNGQHSAIALFDLAVGKNPNFLNKSIAWHIGLSAYLRGPYNSSVLLGIAPNIGISYVLKKKSHAH